MNDNPIQIGLDVPVHIPDIDSNHSVNQNQHNTSSNISNPGSLSNIITSTASNLETLSLQLLSTTSSNTSILSNAETDNTAAELVISNLPISLIAHILSYVPPLQVIRISTLCVSCNNAIKFESSSFIYLHSLLFDRMFTCDNRHNPSYFKRFKSIKYLQIKSDHIQKIMKHKVTALSLWSVFNRLENIELICNNNDNIHNNLILNALETISFHQMRYTLNGLILHNICVNIDLFSVLNNLKTLNTLKFIGNIRFEDNTFNNNKWMYKHLNVLKTQIMHVDNVSILFTEMHCVPYLFISIFLHRNLMSFNIEFDASCITDINHLMDVKSDIHSKCINMKVLCITPHLFCDINYEENESLLSITKQIFFDPDCFPRLEVLKFGDWNSQTWISFVSDRDFITFYEFIIGHYQTLHTLIFKNNNVTYSTSLLNVSMWEPITFLYNIFSKQYEFGDTLDEMSKKKLEYWCTNTLKTFQFEISETTETFQQIVSERDYDESGINGNGDFNRYLAEFDDAKNEWLQDIKFQLKELRGYFKEYNIYYSIDLTFDHQILELKPLFLNYLNDD